MTPAFSTLPSARNLVLTSFAAFALAVISLGVHAGPPGSSGTPFYHYEQFVDVSLPDPLDNPTWSETLALNDVGTVVGVNRYQSVEYPWMIADDVTYKLESGRGRAVAVNNANTAVGWRWLGSGDTEPQARRWVNPTEEGEPLAGLGERGQAWDINEAGVIVGWSDQNPGGEGKTAFRWENGTALLLGTLGGATSEAHAINSRGQITGGAQLADGSTHVFLWENGVMTDLGDFSEVGGTGGIARDITDDGVIVGTMFTSGGDRAFRWENGVVQDLGLLYPLHDHSEALGVNEAGDIVGRSWNWEYPDNAIAFIWRNGVMYDLATQVVEGVATQGLDIVQANDINTAGQITGVSHYNGHSGFVLTSIKTDFEYTVTHLEPPSGTFNVIPRGINDNGEAVGWLYNGDLEPEYRAWKWTSEDGMVMLPPPLGNDSYAGVDLNDAGVITGASVVAFGDGPVWRFDGAAYDFVNLLPGLTWALPTGINAAGDVVGFGDDYTPGPSNTTRYFIHTQPTGVMEIPDGPAMITGLGKINDFQVVTGSSSSGAFRWTIAGGMELLPYPDGTSYGYDINENGQVSGSVAVASQTHAALYTDGVGWELIVNLPGTDYGLAVNNHSEVVGFTLSGDDPGPDQGYETGWVWSPEKGVRVLDDVIEPTGLPTWFHVFRAVDINDAGQILAEGYGLGSLLNSAFILTPTNPPPSPTGDLTGDGSIDVNDLLMLLPSWGDCPITPAVCNGDLDQSGDVGANDLLALLANWTG